MSFFKKLLFARGHGTKLSFLFLIRNILLKRVLAFILAFYFITNWTISEIEALEKVDRKKRLILAMANSINCEGNNSGLILPWPLISGFCLVKEKEKVLRYHTLGQNYFQTIILLSFLKKNHQWLTYISSKTKMHEMRYAFWNDLRPLSTSHSIVDDCDNYVPQWWVELDNELSWLFTNRLSATR